MAAPPPPPPPPPTAPTAPGAPSITTAATKPVSKWKVDLPEAEPVDWRVRYAFHCAAQLGKVVELGDLISAGKVGDINALDEDGWAPLHYASWYESDGHSACITALLLHGANANVRTQPQNATPLHFACGAGRKEAVKRLLQEGKADREAKNDEKQTPLDLLRQLKPDNWKEIETLLLSADTK